MDRRDYSWRPGGLVRRDVHEKWDWHPHERHSWDRRSRIRKLAPGPCRRGPRRVDWLPDYRFYRRVHYHRNLASDQRSSGGLISDILALDYGRGTEAPRLLSAEDSGG